MKKHQHTQHIIKLSSNNLIWIDLEMTGLDPDQDKILEIATVITDKNLEAVIEGPVFAIHQPPAVLSQMDEWNVEQHTKSGLIERVVASKIKEKEAEEATLGFIAKYVPANKSPICGNSICQDRRFLYRHMPQLERYFHYRNLDVSTLKILAKCWYPKIAKEFKKTSKHEALSDIYDSIAELRFYRDMLFIR
jgi:oligoribonuclease